jgi:uncharacterized protein (TIGR00725 family)
MTEKTKIIAVIGASEASANELKMAAEVGQELARRGCAVICGGLGGVMEAVCRGAFEEGGITIGVLPGENDRSANQYVQFPIVTGVGYARNMSVVQSAQAVIAIGGSYGTLSEIGYALKGGIPVVGLNTWQLFRNGKRDNSIFYVETPREAVDLAVDSIR